MRGHVRVLSRRISTGSVWCSLYWRSFETARSGTLCDAVITVKWVFARRGHSPAESTTFVSVPHCKRYYLTWQQVPDVALLGPGRHNKSAGGWWSCWAAPLMPRSLRKVLRFGIWLLRGEFSKAKTVFLQLQKVVHSLKDAGGPALVLLFLQIKLSWNDELDIYKKESPCEKYQDLQWFRGLAFMKCSGEKNVDIKASCLGGLC